MQAPPAPYSLQGFVLASLLPQPFRLVALTGALKIGLAGKGVIQSLREMGVFRREAFGGQMDSRGRLVGATAPVLCGINSHI